MDYNTNKQYPMKKFAITLALVLGTASIMAQSPEDKAAAKAVGAAIAARALEKGITEVVFDRGGYVYHGRVSELAAGAREGGLKF